MELKTDPSTEKKFKAFEGTYPLCTFSLSICLLYPNQTNPMKRAVIYTLLIVLNSVQLFWFIRYTLKCLYTLDFYNFARNMTIMVVLILCLIKSYYIIYATYKFASLLHKMSKDLLEANNLEEDYQEIYEDYIKKGKVGEKTWLLLPTILSVQFPIYAGICMTIESIQTDDFTRLMVHDMELLFIEDIQSETPFFQCIFAVGCINCVVLVPNYCGFDGSFCIATTHLCLKLKLMIHKLHRAFKDAKNRFYLRKLVKEAIKDHQDALDFYTEIQNVYGPWLFALFLLSSFVISFNLYQIYLLKRIDPKYTLFALVAVIHIYMPCQYASTLIKVGEEIGPDIYAVPWESWADPVVTKSLILMIARAQKTLIVTGSGLVIYNMELFKSILQTSYSFFTLIASNKD